MLRTVYTSANTKLIQILSPDFKYIHYNITVTGRRERQKEGKNIKRTRIKEEGMEAKRKVWTEGRGKDRGCKGVGGRRTIRTDRHHNLGSRTR